MPYIPRQFYYATTYDACMYLGVWPVTFLPLFNMLALARPPVDPDISPVLGSGTGVTTAVKTAEIGIWTGLGLILASSKVAAIPYSITMLPIKRHAPTRSTTGPAAATAGAGSALGRSNGLVQYAMCLRCAVGPVVVSTLFTALNGSTWAKKWGISWAWLVVMVCFAVLGATVTNSRGR